MHTPPPQLICISGGRQDLPLPSCVTRLPTSDYFSRRVASLWEKYRIKAWGVEYMSRELFDAAMRELLDDRINRAATAPHPSAGTEPTGEKP